MQLNKQQQMIHDCALWWFYNDPSITFEISGMAGTGKSVLLYEIIKSLGLREYEYLPMAYTGAASLVMRKKGFPNAQTIHSTLYEVYTYFDKSDVNDRYNLPKKKIAFRLKQSLPAPVKLLVVDEGYMVPENMARDILSYNIKTIVVGDSHQLPPVAGKAFFLTSDNTYHLTEIMRQGENNPILYIANRAINGEPIHSGLYSPSVLVIDEDEFCPQMVGFAEVMLCGTNNTRDRLNRYVRQIVGYSSILPLLGERVICRHNNWDLDNGMNLNLVNGLAGTVISMPQGLDPKTKSIFKMSFLPDNTAQPFLDLDINYEYFISDYNHKAQMREMDGEKYITGELFEYAYALSVHLSQGSEYNYGIYFEEFMRPQMQKQLNYTAITRFKHGLIYVRHKNKYH